MSIRLENINYIYSPDNAFRKHALKDINLEIREGEFVGIIGHTGSGKSTLMQLFNGLLRPASGHLYYDKSDIFEEHYNLKILREKVGLVFQYPEHQLFETTVLKDVCFGPKNQGLDEKSCIEKAGEALRLVGLKEKYWEKSPFELSGGQKRRAAIAGVLAMQPEVLILDEPTAGLDPRGKNDILEQIKKLHQELKITIILVSHSMEDVAKYANRLIVMNQGRIYFDDVPKGIFKRYQELEAIGLAAPSVTYIMDRLRKKGFAVSADAMTVDEAKEEILKFLGKDK